MKGTKDIVKGRIEEAAGALLDNEKLRAKGQKDQAVGHIKRAAEKGVRQAKESAQKIIEKAKNVAQMAVDKVQAK
ncbi:MAG: hypothetical protein ACD_79C00025G0017 [uncultured bacterium]|nr:MAG: hypothetical protein ACD_79C00025G0017 [uncultured bacterium]